MVCIKLVDRSIAKHIMGNDWKALTFIFLYFHPVRSIWQDFIGENHDALIVVCKTTLLMTWNRVGMSKEEVNGIA